MRIAACIGTVALTAVVLVGCALAPPSPSQVLTGTVGPNPSASGITREQAIAVARAAVPRYATADVLRAEMGRFDEFVSAFAAEHLSPPPSPDRLVWKVTLGEQPSPTGGQGTDVIIDFWDGRIIIASDWFS